MASNTASLLDRLAAQANDAPPEALFSVLVPRNHLRALIDAARAAQLAGGLLEFEGNVQGAIDTLLAGLAPLLSSTDEASRTARGPNSSRIHKTTVNDIFTLFLWCIVFWMVVAAILCLAFAP